MQQYRAGEEGRPIPLRSDRFYKLGDDWYFQVRGGKSFGPFACRSEAERAVHLFFDPPTKGGGNQKGAVIHPFGRQRAKLWRDNHKH
ncbi:hypothetical protein SAMN04487965_1672 [Microbulbifer donghaiensis]|uniref:DUF6316 domain-containing protein n=1 Tax=Microbulbifer donghaiensis TaxID=494016 RepID=A0A1M4ZWK2_9GAMM|nr:DUF6316 family protein [Microbulbifer donghaiensis]SHF22334.1 hypothetical protein SAMN04487965_1672 [Microbulbifer donghaiensis]